MSLFSRLFGTSKPDPEPASEFYKDFRITAVPEKAEGGYRIGAIIEKDGKRHTLIRADIIGDLETAQQASVTKAQMLIDQIGMRLFDG